MTAKNNPHENHRDRVRDKIKIAGLEPFPDHEVLEYLLFAGVPVKDVNPLAHELINIFGSFANVLDASYDELRAVKGMTSNAALLLSLLPSVFTRYQISKDGEKKPLNSKSDIMAYARRRIGNAPKEVLLLICLDVKKQVLRCKSYTSDSKDKVVLDIKSLLAEAVKCDAYYVATAHNHPSGASSPSIDDLVFARDLKEALTVLGMKYVDNVIIAAKGDLSFAEESKKETAKRKKIGDGSFSPRVYVDFSSLEDYDEPVSNGKNKVRENEDEVEIPDDEKKRREEDDE